MHFHLPKPTHGWREFAGEVGIIVVGVLIALGAEQLVEGMRWRKRVRTTDAAITQEIYVSALNMVERLEVQPCLRQQISKLGQQLNEGNDSWKGLPVELSQATMVKNGGVGPVLAPAYRPPSRIWLNDRWNAAGADGTMSHFPADRASALSGMYRAIDQMEGLQTTEAAAASKLGFLASNRTLTGSDRREMFGALAEVDRVNSLMALVSTRN
jgi:hypothetical protein